jgi:hypothetical protein
LRRSATMNAASGSSTRIATKPAYGVRKRI